MILKKILSNLAYIYAYTKCKMFTSSTLKLASGIFITLSACMAISFDFYENRQLYMLFKPLTTALIILFALWFGKKNNAFFKWVIPALVFCLIGDSLLLYESYFIGGLVAFLIAHVLFAISFISLSGFKFYPITLVLLIVLGGLYYWHLYGVLDDLRWPVLCYFLVIIFMSWQGLNLSIWKRNSLTTILLWAVLLFLTSDAILAWAKFKEAFPYSGAFILATYWASIFLIALATTSNTINEH